MGVLLASRFRNFVSHERKRRDYSVGVCADRGACMDTLKNRPNSAPNLWLNHVSCVLKACHTSTKRQCTSLPDLQIILNFKVF